VDQSGSILKTTVKGFRNAGPESVLTVKGKVERKGGHVTVRATGLFVEN
jgi:hypothetical protein